MEEHFYGIFKRWNIAGHSFIMLLLNFTQILSYLDDILCSVFFTSFNIFCSRIVWHFISIFWIVIELDRLKVNPACEDKCLLGLYNYNDELKRRRVPFLIIRWSSRRLIGSERINERDYHSCSIEECVWSNLLSYWAYSAFSTIL